MNEVKKPERKEHIAYLSKGKLFPVEGFEEARTVQDWIKFGYNQGLADYEPYHLQEIGKLKEKIGKLKKQIGMLNKKINQLCCYNSM